MNNFTGLGRLTKDIELAYTPQGTAVGKSSIAINRPFKNKQTNEYDADFINIVAFGKTAELMANHFKKGSRIGVEGRIQSGSYDGKNGKVYTTDLVVNSVHFVESKQQSQNNQQTQQYQQQAPQNPIAQQGTQINDDSLPF